VPDRIELHYEVENGDRAVGATLCGALAAGTVPKPPGGVRLRLSGFAGQGLGFALVDGVELELEGFANDGVAEAMGGGRVSIRQPPACRREGNGVAGNAVGYGAVGGEIWLEGRAGQRLGVRNSGGLIVAEGAGKYAFEYMTDGIGVLLGPVGPVLGSGLTGGVVFVHDPEGEAVRRLHADAGATGLVGDEPERLRAIVERHHALTGSAVAERLLARWPAALAEFVAIRPAGAAKRIAEDAARARRASASA
jgi:glutamate synthase domain-containing protein 3